MITAAAAKAVSDSFDSAQALENIGVQVLVSAEAGFFETSISMRPEFIAVIVNIENLGYIVTLEDNDEILNINWSAA